MNYLALEDVGAFPTELLTPEFSAALVRENFVDLVIKERLSRAQEDEKLKHFFHMAQGARVGTVVRSFSSDWRSQPKHDRAHSYA